DLDNIKKEIEKIRQEYNQPSLMEQFIEGYEITVPVLGTTHPLALSPVGLQINGKLVCGQKIFSSKMKSETNLVSWTTELPFTKPLIDKIKKWSVLIHKTIGCRDLSRVDFRITVDNEPFFLEINSTPQLTPEEGTFAIAGREKNLSYKDILIRVIDSAKERYFFPTPKTKFH
ncbi:MAG TPA: hypothetical protein ENI61_06800, partial [Ignavibacteria bacterium]|nr:hypothetical protein [Ignavibacteria bacterium]